MFPIVPLLKRAFEVTREEVSEGGKSSALERSLNVDIGPSVSLDEIAHVALGAFRAAGYELETIERHTDMTGWSRRRELVKDKRGRVKALVIMLREGRFFSLIVAPR